MKNKFVLTLGLLSVSAAAIAAPNAALLELQATAKSPSPEAVPAPPAQPAPGQVDAKPAPLNAAQKLLVKTAQDLQDLYRRSEPGPLPEGSSQGAGTVSPGTEDGEASREIIALLWQGKIFTRIDDRTGTLVNKTVVGETFDAKVYFGESLLDGKESIIIDYSETPFKPFRIIRDEIRRVGPGVYLGYAYLRGLDVAPVIFALDFNAPAAAVPAPSQSE